MPKDNSRAFSTLSERYPEYSNLWGSEAGQKQFGRFFDFLKSRYGSKDFDSERAMSVLSTARFKVDTELIRSNWDLFKNSESYNINDNDKDRLRVIKNIRDMIKNSKIADNVMKKVRDIRNGMVIGKAKFSGGFWRDERGRFTKAPKL